MHVSKWVCRHAHDDDDDDDGCEDAVADQTCFSSEKTSPETLGWKYNYPSW